MYTPYRKPTFQPDKASCSMSLQPLVGCGGQVRTGGGETVMGAPDTAVGTAGGAIGTATTLALSASSLACTCDRARPAS